MPHQFFRIVRQPLVSFLDFVPAATLNKPLLDPDFKREWSEGISVFDSFEYAAARAKRARFLLGRYIVEIVLPDDTSIEFHQTGGDRHHFTIYSAAEVILAHVPGNPTYVEDWPL